MMPARIAPERSRVPWLRGPGVRGWLHAPAAGSAAVAARRVTAGELVHRVGAFRSPGYAARLCHTGRLWCTDPPAVAGHASGGIILAADGRLLGAGARPLELLEVAPRGRPTEWRELLELARAGRLWERTAGVARPIRLRPDAILFDHHQHERPHGPARGPAWGGTRPTRSASRFDSGPLDRP